MSESEKDEDCLEAAIPGGRIVIRPLTNASELERGVYTRAEDVGWPTLIFDGIFLACDGFGTMFDNSLPTCAPPPLFVVVFLLFCKVEISFRTLIPLFRPGSVHSGCTFDRMTGVFYVPLR